MSASVIRLVAALAAVSVLAGCGPRDDRPVPIPEGALCARCGMEIHDRRLACEVVSSGKARFFDSIECLRDDPASQGPRAHPYLTDYDDGSLRSLSEVFIVHGNFPTPMGGGLAAFRDSLAAQRVARETQGQVLAGVSWLRTLERKDAR